MHGCAKPVFWFLANSFNAKNWTSTPSAVSEALGINCAGIPCEKHPKFHHGKFSYYDHSTAEFTLCCSLWLYCESFIYSFIATSDAERELISCSVDKTAILWQGDDGQVRRLSCCLSRKIHNLLTSEYYASLFGMCILLIWHWQWHEFRVWQTVLQISLN